ncbi:N-acetylmuramoyl-L-alanine amidase [Alkalithermobacter paradoxus]|uniref:N-acetylmuramoyl-L-alanine amidase LytC n=1 Tax=Alkalithermobacter paradoxus TaxID=29349 RepID=A0A1V4I4H2_9FIRM|nr:N-acetylmuramoyl-L-alanine amidase LytC precursor [[Clostridium] thermoalcaliphilum]
MIKSESMDSIYKDLIAYMVSRNIPLDYHEEALKCQAIIERTILFRKIKDGEHIYNNVDKEDIHPKAYKAVEDTQNLIIMIKDNPIIAHYHISCGGSTQNSESVLNRKIDYLRKVTCEECKRCETFTTQINLHIEELAQKFGYSLPLDKITVFNIDKVLKVIKKDDSDRIEVLEVFGNSIDPVDFINILNLDCTRFGFRPSQITLYIKGSGNGLGLCQYGANEKAKNNWNFDQILNYYYTNINICTVEEFNSKFPLKGKKIFIDPGHGGHDSGNCTEDGLREKDITLNLSIKLRNELKKYGMIANLSRENDEYLSLDERIKKSKEDKHEILISIHVNKSKFESINGAEAFCYWGDTNAENLGKVIMDSISKTTGIKNRGVKEGNFYILRECRISGLYFEIGYLSNESEKSNLSNDEFIQKLSESICEGILKYYCNKMLT